MSKKYDEVMEHIEVTPEMHQRILANIEQLDLSAPTSKKVIRFPYVKQFAAMTACLAIVLVGVFTLQNQFINIDTPNPPVDQVNEGIVEVSSKKELSEAVGFEVEGLDNLPFQAEGITYVAYWQDLAEITYDGEGQTIVYRKGKGSEDISGDYNAYSQVTEIIIANNTVTLKGNDTGYCLAIWSDGDYAYSVALNQEIDESSWKALIE